MFLSAINMDLLPCFRLYEYFSSLWLLSLADAYESKEVNALADCILYILILCLLILSDKIVGKQP